MSCSPGAPPRFNGWRRLPTATSSWKRALDYYAPASRDALHHLERSLLGGRMGEDADPVEADGAVRLLEGGGPRAQFELLAGEVRGLLDDGVPAEEIAIVHRAPSTVAGLLGEVLERYDIPYSMRVRDFSPTRRSAAHCSAYCAAPPATGMWATCSRGCAPPVCWSARSWRIVWKRALAGRACRTRAARASCGKPTIGRSSESTVYARPLPPDCRRWPTCSWELERLFCAPRRDRAAVLDAEELVEARALVAGRRALEQLRELTRAAPELAPSAEDLVEVLGRVEFDGERRSRVGASGGGGAGAIGGVGATNGLGGADRAGAVAVVDPLSLRARRVRMLFCVGSSRACFPRRPPAPAARRAGPSPPRERVRSPVARRAGRARGRALPALRLGLAPEERLTLSWHTASEDGTPLAPSLFVDDIRALFSPSLSERTLRRAAGTAPGELLAPAALAAGSAGHDAPAGLPAVGESTPANGEARAVSGPIQPPREERVLAALRERALWSASSLESWAGCPVRWFVEQLLRGESIDPDPDPLARGALAHAVLKQVFERLRERTGSATLTPASVGLAKQLLGEALEEQEKVHPLSSSPERIPGARRRLAAELERYLASAAENPSPLEPTYFELEFGFDGESLPPLDLGEGVSLRGRIDRVDVGPGGEALVYDYKTAPRRRARSGLASASGRSRCICAPCGICSGRRAVGGFYQPLAGKDIRARGALDGEGGVELDVVRTDRLDGDELERLLEECLAAARAAAGEARAGALAPRPDTCASGGGCAYPTICRCER